MIFEISRTSSCEDPPCEEARKIVVDRIETRTLNSPEEFDKNFSAYEGDWLSRGINHTIDKNGFIQRTHPGDQKIWVIDINTLEELLSLKKKYGTILITESYDSEYLEIEIYDTWRE